MNETISILLVASASDHSEAIRHALATTPQCSRVTVVETLSDAKRFLAGADPDLLLIDDLLPDGRGMELLPQDPDQIRWPVLFLIAPGDQQAMFEAVKRGALDCLVKTTDSLASLPYLIERSRREWQLIVKHRRALRKTAEFGRLLDASLNEIYTFDAETLHFIQVNRGARKNLGYTMEELRNLTPIDLKLEFSKTSFEAMLEPLRSGSKEGITFCSTHRRKDGSSYPVEAHLQLLTQEDRPVFVAILLDISERRQTEEALKRSEERFRSIFETAAAGMVMISPNGLFLQVNPAFVSFVGYEKTELLQMSVLDVTHPEDRASTQEYYRLLAQDPHRIIDTEKRYLRKDGTIFWGHTSVACVLGEKTAEEYCVGLVQDISERKQMETQLQQANRELDAFVSTVSHDLRNPLVPIIGYAQYLKSSYADKLDPQAIDLLDEIDRQGHRMTAMIEDLLILAKAGALKLPDKPVALSQVVSEVLHALASRIIEGDIEVRVGELPEIRLPKTLLSQIFDNLIGNAIRYAGHAGSPIEVGGWQDGNRVRLFVCDHGPGIPEEEKREIFETYFRGTSGKCRNGAGIGLATIKRIARLYDGRAWVEDTPGGGATFWIELVG